MDRRDKPGEDEVGIWFNQFQNTLIHIRHIAGGFAADLLRQ
jgi:hypothetical protein